jgi:putative transposase
LTLFLGRGAAQRWSVSRPPRPELVDVPQHVIQRGNDRAPCFHDDADRRRYLSVVAEMALRYGCALHAYVLMTNHVHLLVTPDALGAMSSMMQGIGRRYVAEFNVRHGRTGTLWEGRFKSCLVDSEGYVLACYRYIEMNPVRAGIVSDPSEYAWSSHAANLGNPSILVRPHDAYLALGATSDARTRAYHELFADALTDTQLRDIRLYVQQQRALGTDRFRAMVEAKLGRRATARPAHRPAATQWRKTHSDPPP